jgi:hypothetical protein
MKSLLLISCLLLTITPSNPQKSHEDLGLPELHKIQAITLSPSYSCRSNEDFQKGYAGTALFLSKSSNGPALLFNGACGAQDYLEGQDLTVIADLGKVRLEDLRAEQTFNVQRVHSFELYSKFLRVVQPEVGHTYAVVLNTPLVRGRFYFTITGYVPNQRLDLRYAVKEYQLIHVLAVAPGFDWDRKSD